MVMNESLPFPETRVPAVMHTRSENFLAEFLQRLGASAPPAVRTPMFQAAARHVFLGSDYVAQLSLRHPEYVTEWLDPAGQVMARCDGAWRDWLETRFATIADEVALKAFLREVRHRELLRIAWRDLLDQSPLAEVLHDVSSLADVLVDLALRWQTAALQRRYGVPRAREDGEEQHLVVLGMGKLGGQELNFSSDIDLIFAYHHPGSTDGPRSIDNQEFFTRLGRALIAALADVTAEGFCYRVDMRLRPFGSTGPLVMHFDAMEDYYQAQGREWERYALIKARVMAGDRVAGACLMEKLQPFIYRRYLDYGAFANLRKLKEMINEESARRERREDIKHGEGGIREIEFIAQVFQLVRGGREPSLQRRDCLGTLAMLGERRLLPLHAVEALTQAYVFLRRVENRLQMLTDQQTHQLPAQPEERLRIAWMLGFTDLSGFMHALQQQLQRVHAQFEQVFAAPQQQEERSAQTVAGEGRGAASQAWQRLWLRHLDSREAIDWLAVQGFAQPESAWEAILSLSDGPVSRSLSETGRERLDRLMPLLLGAVARLAHPDPVLLRTLTLIRTIARRSVYLSLLVEHPLALSQLVQLCEASAWIAEQLTRFPLLLDELLDPRTLYAPPDQTGLQRELRLFMAHAPPGDEEQELERLRQFRQAQTLRIAAADITGHLSLMKVSDHLTWLAEVLLQHLLERTWAQMAERYGEPWCGPPQARRRARLGIVGYGKLGGLELGYGSDLDLVFLHDSCGEQARTSGPRVVDNAEFFARVAQKMVLVLGAFTPAGRLYEVDTRLRPSGASGLLVSGLEAFAAYQASSAWTWEHQALVRARWVAGDPALGEDFAQVREEILCRPRDPVALRVQVGEMRAKMLAEHATRDAAHFDLKRDHGGITDIEFMVQYWVLAHAHAHPQICRWSDKVRTLELLGQVGVIEPGCSQALADLYRSLRNRIHRLTLAGESSRVRDPDPDLLAQRQQIRELWMQVFGTP